MLGSIIGGLATGLLNNAFASDRQEDAQSFNSAQFASRYQTTMKDMEAAGLNPGLAYGGISGSPPSSGIAGSSGFPDLGAVQNQNKIVSAQAANLDADTANKESQGKLYEAQAAAAWGSADQAHANVRLIGENVNKIMAEIPNIRDTNANIRDQGVVLRRTAEMLSQQADLMKQQGMTQPAIREQLVAQVGKLVTETALNTYDLEAISKFDNFGKEAGQLKPFFDLLRMFIRR